MSDVLSLLDLRAAPKPRRSDETYPVPVLHWAASRADTPYDDAAFADLLRLVVRLQGHDVIATNPSTHDTALHYAATAATAAALVDAGAALDAVNGDGFTPLILAAQRDRPDVILLLLERGADPAIPTAGGAHTNLTGAIVFTVWDDPVCRMRGAIPSIVSALVTRGVSLLTTDDEGRSVAYRLADAATTFRGDNKEITKLLIAAIASCGAAEALEVASASLTNLVRDSGPLLDGELAGQLARYCGAPVVTAGVICAAMCRSPDEVRLLLSHGDAVSRLNDLAGGTTPLLAAIASRRQDLLELLLSAGADACVTGRDGVSPLHTAVLCGSAAMATALIAAGAHVNATATMWIGLHHITEITPLHMACSSEDATPAVINLLLDHEANARMVCGESGMTAFDVWGLHSRLSLPLSLITALLAAGCGITHCAVRGGV